MININGDDWEILLVSSNHPFLLMPNGEFALGACDDPTKTIVIREDVNDYHLKKILCHELTHAAMFSYNINLTYEQEELLADITATYGLEIVEMTNKIFKSIKKKLGE